jgi:anti-anti-sigma factor
VKDLQNRQRITAPRCRLYKTSLHRVYWGWGMQTTVDFGQRIALAGRVDATTAAAVRDVLHGALLDGTGELVVDMSGVEALDAVGLGVLMGTHRRAIAAGRSLVLAGCQPRIARLLRAIRLHRVLQMSGDAAAA